MVTQSTLESTHRRLRTRGVFLKTFLQQQRIRTGSILFIQVLCCTFDKIWMFNNRVNEDFLTSVNIRSSNISVKGRFIEHVDLFCDNVI